MTFKTQEIKDAAIVVAQKTVDTATPANLADAKEVLADTKAAQVG